MFNRVSGLLSVGGLLAIGVVSALWFNLARFRDSLNWVEHTNGALYEISTTEVSLLRAESAERDWILSGDLSYFKSYRRAAQQVTTSLQVLEKSLSTDAAQRQRFEALRGLIDARLANFAQAVELGPSRRDEALAILTSERNQRRLTPLISDRLEEMRRVEADVLAEQEAGFNRAAAWTTATAIAMTLLAIASTAFGVFLFKRQQALVQLRSANEQLQAAQSSLISRETYLEAILATVSDGMIAIDKAGIIVSLSVTAERLFQMTADEARGRALSSLFPELAVEEFGDFLAQDKAQQERFMPKTREFPAHRKDGTIFPVELSIGQVTLDGAIQFIAFVRDLTERQARERQTEELQSELLHVTRLTNMGDMASALAHELSQPLTALGLYLQGARRLLSEFEDEKVVLARRAMRMAVDQALRAGQIIRRLREFVSRGETEKRIESLRRMVQEAFALAILGAMDPSVRFNLALDPSVDLVVADKIQIQQVLLNLVRNALEAMQDSPRRELRITSAPASDGMVEVSVADTGSGIAPEIADQLFQPFMTTKKDGLGVGLSLSRNIIEAHHGRIEVEPNPGGGTIFRFSLRSGMLKDAGGED